MLNFFIKLFKAPLYLAIRAYFSFRHLKPIWLYILNREGRREYLKNVPQLDAAQQRIIRELKTNGIAVTHLDELFPGQNLPSQLKNYTEQLLAKEENKNIKTDKKVFLKYLWAEIPTLSFDNPFVKLALNQKVLDIVNSYMGLHAKFFHYSLNVTLPMPQNADAIASQRWHRDPEDKKLCKMFIYLDDVDEGAGPFIYIPGSQYGGRYNKIFSQQPPKGVYPSIGAVEKLIGKDAAKICLGRAGTVIFADTAGLHRGGYATAKKRIMSTTGFMSQASPRRIRYHYSGGEVDWLTPAGRFALKRSVKKLPLYALYLAKLLKKED